MKAQRVASGLILLLSAIGSFASVYSIQEPMIRYPMLSACLLITFTALYLFLASYMDLWNAFRNLTTIRSLGIRRVYSNGTSANELVRSNVKKAKSIRIVSVSGDALIKMLKDDLIYALRTNSASVRVLLATPNSQFVRDVEESENINRIGHISPEIVKAEALLREYLVEAKSSSQEHSVIGKVALGHYTTHLRSSLVLCDNAWGWLTLSLPPIRAVQSPSFELSYADGGLFTSCSTHFERVWGILMSRDSVREINIHQAVEDDRQIRFAPLPSS
jgi:hypothetical protein